MRNLLEIEVLGDLQYLTWAGCDDLRRTEENVHVGYCVMMYLIYGPSSFRCTVVFLSLALSA